MDVLLVLGARLWKALRGQRYGAAGHDDLDPSFLTVVPQRIKYLEVLYDHMLAHDGVVMWTSGEIFDWYVSETAGG